MHLINSIAKKHFQEISKFIFNRYTGSLCILCIIYNKEVIAKFDFYTFYVYNVYYIYVGGRAVIEDLVCTRTFWIGARHRGDSFWFFFSPLSRQTHISYSIHIHYTTTIILPLRQWHPSPVDITVAVCAQIKQVYLFDCRQKELVLAR